MRRHGGHIVAFGEFGILASLAVWLFPWDDEIDEPTGRLTDDLEASQNHRSDTVRCIEHPLRLEAHENIDKSFHPTIGSFSTVGDVLRVKHPIDQ